MMARRPAEDVTDTELAILQVLWHPGDTTRRRITDVLCPGGGEVHYASVQNLLGRLERKGFVQSAPDGNVLAFTATVGRDDLIRNRHQGLADKLCGGSVAPLAMSLIRSRPLFAAEVDKLYTLLREQRRRLKPPGNQPQ
jgi:BlaI family transcriptional regulator, penicillinase repressor